MIITYEKYCQRKYAALYYSLGENIEITDIPVSEIHNVYNELVSKIGFNFDEEYHDRRYSCQSFFGIKMWGILRRVEIDNDKKSVYIKLVE